jgi:HrpA-like RNA helicase
MDLSQLVLHSLSLYNPESSNPLQLLLDVPDPPQASRLRQTLRSLAYQALIDYDPDEEEKIALTPLGRVVSALPASPRIGRMLIMGMALRAVDPALKIAALLSVPRTFQVAQQPRNKNDWHDSSAQEEIKHSSDLVMVLEAYQDYLKKDERNRMFDRMHVQFRQAIRVEQQLQQALKATLLAAGKLDVMEEWRRWNLNGHRVGALLAIICAATPLIAHLVDGRMYFATRDSPGEARIHPGSVNGGPYHRAHWYLYHEQRTTTAPYLHVTTAASPLELALFCEASTIGESDDKSGGGPHYAHYVLQGEESLFVVDQWIPVAVAIREQRDAFLYLRNLITNGMLQHISQDPKAVLDNQVYKRIVLFVLSALEQQRMK